MIVRLALVTGTVFFFAHAPARAADSLVPHKAIYRISQLQAAGGLARAEGWVVTNNEATCQGWSIQYVLAFHAEMSDGRVIDSELKASTWESLDGLKYRFDVQNVNGERLAGDATLQPDGGGGEVIFTTPPGRHMDLPEGTVFPIDFARRLLGAARDGGARISATVFDSAHSAFLVRTTVAVGSGDLASDEARRSLPLVRGLSWPLRFHFADVASASPATGTDFAARIFDNGIYGDMVFDFGQFAIRAELEQVEPNPEPNC